jgi:hypothetical protein
MSEQETRFSMTDIEDMKVEAINMGASTEFIADCLNKYGPEVLSTVTEGLRNGFSFAFILECFRLFGPFVLDFFISLLSKNKMQANMLEIVNQKTLGATALSREDINNFVLNQNDELMSSNLVRVFIEKILPYVGKKYGPLIIEAVIDAITKAIDEDKL